MHTFVQGKCRILNFIQTDLIMIVLFVWIMDPSSEDKWAAPWSEHGYQYNDKVLKKFILNTR